MQIDIQIAENGAIRNVIAYGNEQQIIEVKTIQFTTVIKDQTKIIIS